MTDLADVVRRVLAEVPSVKVTVGTYQGADGSQVAVNVGGAQVLMSLHSAAWPMPGERVVCVNLAGRWMCLGPESPRQQWGIVHSLGTGTATVEYPPGSGVTAQMLVPKGDTPVVGDFALLDWANGGVIVRLYSGEPAPPAPDEPGSPSTSPVTRVFRAVDAGTVDGNGSWIRQELYARTTPQGAAAWFHGTRIRDAVGSKTVLSGRIYIPIFSPGGGDILMGWHTSTSKSGVPAINGGVVVKPSGGWFDLPLPLAQALASTGRGISFRTNSGGAPVYKSLGQDPLSGQVEITYR